MGIFNSFMVLLIYLVFTALAQIKEFVSIDCGCKGNYSDSNTGLAWISDDIFIKHGRVAEVKTENDASRQYKFYRYFPADNKKYCYTLNTIERRRYLVRATFRYGDSYPGSTYPMFELYLDSTRWATITIKDTSRVYVEEMIIRAQSATLYVCLCSASTGYPFISTLELRALNQSMYLTEYEEDFFLKVAARINFGALSAEPIRYPDDPFDRIWESDLAKRQNFLVGMAPGTENISTTKDVKTDSREFPPVKVMQTAVIGTRGILSYRLDLEDFPGNARAFAYLAEIEDLEFVSIDCGCKGNYSDSNTGLAWISDDIFIKHGRVAEVKTENDASRQYKFYRYFPADNKKYCYTLNTIERRRYLVRATFRYGDSYPGSTYPMFELYLDSTRWATITIKDTSRVYVEEMIIRAQSATLYVCLCSASTGYPFISTLELRALNQSMYLTEYEEDFFLKVAARINFGALSAEPIRYPDDPFDRIWESDLAKRQNFLVGMAPGTENISTTKDVKTDSREFPPVKVMQTAVIGTRGILSYRLDLEDFPGNARAFAYLAEIEDLGKNETRKFTMKQPNVPGYDNVIVNIAENANGNYALYEPSYMNVSLDFVLSLSFSKTRDSNRGPLLNAIEVSKYVQIIPKTSSQDVTILNAFCSMPSTGEWKYESGDPCIPVAWDWVSCSSTIPSRITKIVLSNMNLEGYIPSEIKHMDQLEELWLDGNFLSGPIPDLSNLTGLKILHLENNRLNGVLPSYFGDLPSLQALYIQNNNFSGEIPHPLLSNRFLFNSLAEFVSIDCGCKGNYSDSNTGLAWISDDIFIKHGRVAEVKTENDASRQYKFYRYFPADNKKYCYTLNTIERRRYLVRATFRYGDSYPGSTYPMFELYLDSTRWATITIKDTSRVYVEEMIIRAQSATLYVCLCSASTGYPFISTLELRALNQSMYLTEYEEDFFLKVAARINFGALSAEPIRYPDDPFDRIWESDLAKRQNFLVGMAPGTENISTTKDVKTDSREFPPVKVMQTAVIGTRGILSYRLDLEDFPGNARAFAYLAEIEDLGKNETRKFTMKQPNVPGYDNVIVNIAENANGNYALYEPSYMNVSLDFVLSLSFSKTRDSNRGPLLNAIEVSKYVQIIPKTSSQDVTILNAFCSMPSTGEWKYESGDPCIPVAWDWVSCSSTIPSRITKIVLSNMNLEGYIPSEIKHMDQLEELWLDGNFLSGPIPDLSNLTGLKILHLENNRLNGVLPSYFGDLPSLQALYIQNNNFSGEIPHPLLSNRFLFNYEGNPGLNLSRRHKNNLKIILATTIGSFVSFLLLLLLGYLWLLWQHQKNPEQSDDKEKSNSLRIISKSSIPYSIVRSTSLVIDEGLDAAYCIALSALEEATNEFSKKIGEGSYGPVYYGKMKDGKEVAVKLSADLSTHGTQQFINEVTLLSRIHHKCLVPLIGYCQEDCNKILVYEYIHNGTLRDYIHDPCKKTSLNWLSRLLIAEDAAKGLAYLHNGCNPAIIHRDVKTSNILLDINMRAKVSDFGLSREAENSLTHISSIARGTIGYVDPEYYANQQLTDKSDVYSFGVVLLEIISGKKPISVEDYGVDWNIVHWARSLIIEGDITSLVDPCLAGTFKTESLWRIAEIAILSVQVSGVSRPKMSEVELAIHDAITIEMGSKDKPDASSCSSASPFNHVKFSSLPFDAMIPNFNSIISVPSLR